MKRCTIRERPRASIVMPITLHRAGTAALASLALFSALSAGEMPSFPHSTLAHDNPGMTLDTFAFGSCCKQSHRQGHWPVIVSNKPQFWLWLGDNIYADTEDMKVLEQKYNELGSQPGYVQLKKTCPVVAIWDDHDYGRNDAGNDYAMREGSQRVFLNFFNERKDSPRWNRPGIYTSHYFGKGERRVQVILLDTRYFRTALKRIDGKPPYRPMGKYTPNSSHDASMLGDAQWRWLEDELGKPARLRLICTSVQFCAPHNGFEGWANMPLEKQRMISLIKSTRAEGVVFLSGDIHGAEMCIEEPEGCYPLVDFTSSSLNVPLGAARTRRRAGPGYGGRNFGMVEIDWDRPDPVVTLSIRDMENATRLRHGIALSGLSFGKKNMVAHTPDAMAGTWQTHFGTMVLEGRGKDKPGSLTEWTGQCGDRTLDLKWIKGGLRGTWRGKNRSGKVSFRLSRDGRFLFGSYSDGDLPLQLDWAGWKPDWEKHFKRDHYGRRGK